MRDLAAAVAFGTPPFMNWPFRWAKREKNSWGVVKSETLYISIICKNQTLTSKPWSTFSMCIFQSNWFVYHLLKGFPQSFQANFQTVLKTATHLSPCCFNFCNYNHLIVIHIFMSGGWSTNLYRSGMCAAWISNQSSQNCSAAFTLCFLI